MPRLAGLLLRRNMRLQLGAAFFLLLSQAAFAESPACEQAAFASVVTDASAVLSSLNETNKKVFQAKLMALKTREGWTDGDYAAMATPFVKDDTTAALDAGNKALLDQVPQLGNATAAAGDTVDARCAMLADLRTLMSRVVENTRAKWAHMLGKLDAALETSRQTVAAGQ